MSFSSCPKCWDTPCTCGHQYKDWTKEAKIKLASRILGVGENGLIDLTDGNGRYIVDDHCKDKSRHRIINVIAKRNDHEFVELDNGEIGMVDPKGNYISGERDFWVVE